MESRTHEEMREELVNRATNCTEFRKRLLAEPKAAIREALGIDLPDPVTVRVLQSTATLAHIVLPPCSRLSAADLEHVVASHRYSYFVRMYAPPHRH